MRSTRRERKEKQYAGEELPSSNQMLSRKLRYSKRKRLSYTSLVTIGLVVFGTLFIGLFVMEMIQSRNTPTAQFVPVKQAPDQSGPAQATESANDNASKAPDANEEGASATGDNAASPQTGGQKSVGSAAEPTDGSKQAGQVTQTETKHEPAKAVSSEGTTVKSTDTTAVEPAVKPAGGSAKEAVKSPSIAPQKPPANEVAKEAAKRPATAQNVVRHVVKQGDTLYSLSRQYYGNKNGVEAIARYNGLQADGILVTGTVLSIPLPAKH